MRDLLVIAQQTGLAAAVRSVLDPEHYRVGSQSDLHRAELLLRSGSIDCCIVDADLVDVEPIRIIEKIRRQLPDCPIVIYAGERQWEWEEDAYLLGVQHVLNKPVRGRLLNTILDRLFNAAPPSEPRPIERPRTVSKPVDAGPISTRMLEVLRDFSSILTHSLCAESLSKQFLMLLREIIGVNRAAIFFRHAPGSLDEAADPERGRRLRAGCALGLAHGLLDYFELSMETGIGGSVFRSGRILRRDSEETNSEMRKEFELLGAEVAIPILDRESFVGVAIFDGRLTGERLTNEELALIFHLLEELGMAIRNIWLHDQLAGSHEMMADILRQLESACIVIGRDLTVLHANEMARSCFLEPAATQPLNFSDLPQPIASKVFEMLKTGQKITPFRFAPANVPEKIYQVAITPFQKQNATLPSAALLLLEDFTKIDRLHHLEMEAANLRLVKQIAERLAHEIGNAVVPLSTHHQLLKHKAKDPEFLESFDHALGDGVRRVTRLVNQMRFLATDRLAPPEKVPVQQLIEQAFRDACEQQPVPNSLLQFENAGQALTVLGDRVGLQHAFAEVILNALQANLDAPQIQISARPTTSVEGTRMVQIEVRDNGAGFGPETAGKVPEPFFTTRNVGLGLGLAVSNKIIETHRGRMEILGPQDGKGTVRILLPMEHTPKGRPFRRTTQNS